ncbi:GAP family protein [Nocardia huaxiensis]|uniref:GAP family protein n=1 Tax=Nocardia huaxiensis TaxID=2755382 RepID=A0A7D6ZL20_9NOCA|nr:GAP family protein [Nocardia huaxiensis]QLY33207.1 GAP family protein [Nocardia huaxiensis]UFS99862.1 GAP family protein [Nocardia huaxiensis]
MQNATGQILMHAVGVAISPLAIIAVILILAGPHGRKNALAFALGWVTAVTAGLLALVVIGEEAGAHRDGHPASWIPWFRVVFGVLILLMALRQLRIHNALETGGELPPRLRALDEFTPGRCVALGAVLALSNPKNITQIAVGGVTVAEGSAGSLARTLAVVVFIVIASLCILIPLGVHYFGGSRAHGTLERWKEWTVRNHAGIMAMLLTLLGVKTFGDGLSGLL